MYPPWVPLLDNVKFFDISIVPAHMVPVEFRIKVYTNCSTHVGGMGCSAFPSHCEPCYIPLWWDRLDDYLETSW